MAYDKGLAERVRRQLGDKTSVVEKHMFGGLCFMINGHMCCGIVKEQLMARVGPRQYNSLLKKDHASEMNFTGRAMKGMIYLAPEGLADDKQLADWLGYCLKFVDSLPPK